MLIERSEFEVQQIRLNNIKYAAFIVPSKESTVEKVNLSDCIPLVNSDRQEHLL